MEWGKLLSTQRLGREEKPAADVRSEFQRDFDRVVYSSAFRRLQDKTQVFPLAESDYVRTRLTHSIEVSSVGRSLGRLVGEMVEKREPVGDIDAREFGNVVAAACLAHDIGNPPFGHSGEEAMRAWFKEEGEPYLARLNPDQREDFRQFEGNAQGFRVLTRLQNAVDRGGLQMTYAVLGAYMKYPRIAHLPELPVSKKVSEKKFGICIQDRPTFNSVAEGIGLVEKVKGAWSRHPLAFLMEAADDICYRIVDLEDGQRLGRVPFDETEALLKPIAFDDDENTSPSSYELIDDEKNKIEYLRARAINSLVYAVVTVFESNYESILKGIYEEDLVPKTKFAIALERIKKVSQKKVYATPTVVQIEAAGYEVLGGLLKRVVPAVVHGSEGGSAANRKVLELIPPQFKKGRSEYERLLSATDFVSGMTDTYAVTLYRRLSGIELPRG
jgi:dGTPase